MVIHQGHHSQWHSASKSTQKHHSKYWIRVVGFSSVMVKKKLNGSQQKEMKNTEAFVTALGA